MNELKDTNTFQYLKLHIAAQAVPLFGFSCKLEIKYENNVCAFFHEKSIGIPKLKSLLNKQTEMQKSIFKQSKLTLCKQIEPFFY